VACAEGHGESRRTDPDLCAGRTAAMNRSKRMNARAFTLVELLVCIGMIAMILAASGMCFAQVVRLRGAHERYSNRMASADYLLRRIARDVREAQGFAASAGEFKAGEACVILRVHDGFVVYQVKETGVARTQIGPQETRGVMVMDNPVLRVRFGFEGTAPADARSVVTTIDWEEHPRIGISRPMLSLRVACRAVPIAASEVTAVQHKAETGGEG